VTRALLLASSAAAVDTPEFNPWVTRSSRFRDPVWTFDRLNPSRPASFFRINWCQPLGGGATLTDALFAALLADAKCSTC
jgi:hypothetical protein